MNFGLAGAAEVGRALRNATESQGSSFGCDLFGEFGGSLVDGVAGVLFGGRVTTVVKLVVAGVEGEGLHHVGAGAQELAMETENYKFIN